MLIKYSAELERGCSVALEKAEKSGGRDLSRHGAFATDAAVIWKLQLHRMLGAAGAQLHLWKDGEEPTVLSFRWQPDGSFALSLSMGEIGIGLYFYQIVLDRGGEDLYLQSDDNVHCTPAPAPGAPFRLLIYDAAFATPAWMHGGVMYHVFVDRFCRSGKVAERRADAEYVSDWDGPISQYGAFPGAPVKNNAFFGGDLWGVIEKLPYLSDLGVTVLYLSPVFTAYSNHKYDTGDYERVDPGFGGDAALTALICAAKERGIRVILDGVFNHTGDDSVYFDKYGHYGSGAYKNPASPYRNWYHFGGSDDEYAAWWGISILPKLNQENPACRRYFTGAEGIGARYVRQGTGGWRLDVADELSDAFLSELRTSVKAADPEAVLIGEVWENAAEKIAYGKRRQYFWGAQLDSVMNYPLRQGIIDFLRSGDGAALARVLTEIYATYPKCVCDCLMNILGTHDTERILTALADADSRELRNDQLAVRQMDAAARAQGVALLRLAAVIQYTVYGIPSVFYGDEAGVEGGRDPFCRKAFPWGREDAALQSHYRRLGTLRRLPVFAEGDFAVCDAGAGYIRYRRTLEDEEIEVAVNVGKLPLPLPCAGYDLLTETRFPGDLPPGGAVVLRVSPAGK